MSIEYLGGKSATKRYQLLASLHLLDFFRMIEAMHWIIYNDSKEALPKNAPFCLGLTLGPAVRTDTSTRGKGKSSKAAIPSTFSKFI